MQLGELGEFLSSTLEFDLDGRHYSVPPIDWPSYLELVKVHAHAALVAAGKADEADGPEDKPLYEQAETILGPVFGQLIEAGVHPAKIAVIARGAYLWQIGQDDAAQIVLSGKLPAPTSISPTPTGSTGTAAGTTTKPRGSTSTTTSPRESKPQSGRQPVSTRS